MKTLRLHTPLWFLSLALSLPTAGWSQTPCELPPAMMQYDMFGVTSAGLDSTYKSYFEYYPSLSWVTRVIKEREDTDAEWETQGQELTTSYAIVDIAPRDGGEYVYVAGLQTSDCTDVIEEWRFSPADGAFTFRASASPTTSPPIPPVGTPAPPLTLHPEPNGGTFVAPSERGHLSAPRRTVLYTGTSLGHIRSMEVDPQGRFLLIQSHGDSGIYQLDLLEEPPLTPQMLFSAAAIPELLTTTTLATYDNPAVGGRFFLLMQTDAFGDLMLDSHRVLIEDYDNDGVLGPAQVFDPAA